MSSCLHTLDSPGVKKNTLLKWLEMKNVLMWVQGCVVKGHSFKGFIWGGCCLINNDPRKWLINGWFSPYGKLGFLPLTYGGWTVQESTATLRIEATNNANVLRWFSPRTVALNTFDGWEEVLISSFLNVWRTAHRLWRTVPKWSWSSRSVTRYLDANSEKKKTKI